ncbi:MULTISPECIES: hypothetical protein [unclassified Saccharicrinis]|uniref:hypothetical protein n=1 Tax=unclassified Saccharicrinis TaxID=2646859 RepID=UPI003D348A91
MEIMISPGDGDTESRIAPILCRRKEWDVRKNYFWDDKMACLEAGISANLMAKYLPPFSNPG